MNRTHPWMIPVFALALALAPVAACAQADTVPAAGDSARIAEDIAILASDRLGGRGTGSPGGEEAVLFLMERLQGMGLAPLFPDVRCPHGRGACPPEYGQEFRPPLNALLAARLPRDVVAYNVAAVVPGTDPVLRDEYVVVGAHHDHLGRSPIDSRDPHDPLAIRNGADDNASGTAAVLALARRFQERPARRSVIFVAFGAEELGLHGSRYFVDHAPVPVRSMVAMLNLDMVGRLRDGRLTVYGTGSAPGLKDLVEKAADGTGLRLRIMPSGTARSDHASFAARGIPALHFFTALHPDYHTARDDADKVNVAGIVQVVELAEDVLREIADRDPRLAPPRGRLSIP